MFKGKLTATIPGAQLSLCDFPEQQSPALASERLMISTEINEQRLTQNSLLTKQVVPYPFRFAEYLGIVTGLEQEFPSFQAMLQEVRKHSTYDASTNTYNCYIAREEMFCNYLFQIDAENPSVLRIGAYAKGDEHEKTRTAISKLKKWQKATRKDDEKMWYED